MKRFVLLFVAILLAATLTACSNGNTLESVGLDGLTGKEILTGIADGSIAIDGYDISVYDHELVVFIDNTEITVDMPEDEFYLSVAPYDDLTHDCTFHSATRCQGQLVEEEFFVEFIDTDGNIILSETMSTMSNGFIDLWLPRNVEGTLTITQGELSASKTILTTSGQPTCETTMRLQ